MSWGGIHQRLAWIWCLKMVSGRRKLINGLWAACRRGNDATNLKWWGIPTAGALKGVLETERAKKPSAFSLWDEGSFFAFLPPLTSSCISFLPSRIYFSQYRQSDNLGSGGKKVEGKTHSREVDMGELCLCWVGVYGRSCDSLCLGMNWKKTALKN